MTINLLSSLVRETTEKGGDEMGTEATQGAGSARCDICGDEIVAGERFTDDGAEVTHNACVAQWFRSNFGREGLS